MRAPGERPETMQGLSQDKQQPLTDATTCDVSSSRGSVRTSGSTVTPSATATRTPEPRSTRKLSPPPMSRRGETKQRETNSNSLKGKVLIDADCHGTVEEVAAAPSKRRGGQPAARRINRLGGPLGSLQGASAMEVSTNAPPGPGRHEIDQGSRHRHDRDHHHGHAHEDGNNRLGARRPHRHPGLTSTHDRGHRYGHPPTRRPDRASAQPAGRRPFISPLLPLAQHPANQSTQARPEPTQAPLQGTHASTSRPDDHGPPRGKLHPVALDHHTAVKAIHPLRPSSQTRPTKPSRPKVDRSIRARPGRSSQAAPCPEDINVHGSWKLDLAAVSREAGEGTEAPAPSVLQPSRRSQPVTIERSRRNDPPTSPGSQNQSRRLGVPASSLTALRTITSSSPQVRRVAVGSGSGRCAGCRSPLSGLRDRLGATIR